MKNFFRYVLANIVAILIIGGVFVVSFILFIVASAAGDGQKSYVKDNSVLVLDSKMTLIDSPAENEDGVFSFNSKVKRILVYDVVKAIQKAKTDPKIKGISIESDLISGGLTQIDYVRSAVEDFKKSGKFVYAYGNVVSQPSYFLGSVADKYFLNPAGGIDLKGMGTEVTYLKSFADKYGIGMEILRHGKYKSAVEPFMRDDMSPENREQLTTLLQDIWGNVSAKISASRKTDVASFNLAVDSLYGIIPESALREKLTDQLVQKTEYDRFLMGKLKVKEEKKLNKVNISKYLNSLDDDDTSKSDAHVAVLYASGNIMNGEDTEDIHAENFVKHIKKLAEDKNVKSVVLRINSPGGSANASDEILFELQQLKKKKPLVVSFGDYAASGGYYIAMGADRIFSEPNTLTGSIGVFGMIPYAKELAARNGISAHGVATNANSNGFSLINGISPGTRTRMQHSVESTYRRFVHFVTQNRKKTFEQVDELGGGRVWSGARAKQLGLVDELGSLSSAIAYAAKKANLKSDKVVSYPGKRNPFEDFFGNMSEDEISAKIISRKIGQENYRMLELLTNPKLQGGVQMGLPFTIKFD